MYTKAKLAPLLSTGNNTHSSQSVPDSAEALSVAFNVTAVGGSPTVTYKLQGSLDDKNVADSASAWFDLILLPGDSDTAAVSFVKTTVATFAQFLSIARMNIRKVRLVTSANTNVTYNADLATK